MKDMITPNPDIEEIIATASNLAKSYNHEYVTLEHLLVALITFKSFNKLLLDHGVNTKELTGDLCEYISVQDHLVNLHDDMIPKKTHALERVFNRAFTQVLFSARSQIETIDLYLSITQETNSHAAYFLLKWNVYRKELISFYNQTHQLANPGNIKSKKSW